MLAAGRRNYAKDRGKRQREWRAANPERAAVIRLEHRRKKRDFVKVLKREKGCQRCGLRDEIEKCDVLCANCHRIAHHEEGKAPPSVEL